jgi:hypothetical protein
MNTRLFYSAAVMLGLIALVLGFAGRDRSVQASVYRAKRIASAHENHAPYTRDAQAIRLAHDGRLLSTVTAVFTGLGLCCMVVALLRREKGYYLILSGLLVSDVMALMLL